MSDQPTDYRDILARRADNYRNQVARLRQLAGISQREDENEGDEG